MWDASLGLIPHVQDSIHYIHTRGVIHRDIKPENFLYRNRSNPKDFVITDFGLAKVLDEAAYGRDRRGEEMVSIKEVCGTPGYAGTLLLTLSSGSILGFESER